MKLDNKLKKDLFTSSQRFFLGCWFNMVHPSSLDSHRVKAINPFNALAELHKVLNFIIANNDDIGMIYTEAKSVLNSDPLLKVDKRFQEIVAPLFSKLDKEKSANKFTKKCTLTNSLLREATNYVGATYLDSCFKVFNDKVVESETLSENEQSQISIITGSFLSYLMHSGASFETLMNYYQNILTNHKKNKEIPFASRLKLLKKIVSSTGNEYDIIFRLEFHSKELITSFPDEIDGITFVSQLEGMTSAYSPLNKILNSTYPTLKFARIKVNARDERHAGALAYSKVYSVIDLVRFEYITKPIVILDDFICITDNANHPIRLFTVPKLVPNPTASVTEVEFGSFISMIGSLVGNQSIKKDDKDQIFSSFKFYRIGGDTSIDENRLVNWWIAVEHLSQSNKSGSNIGSKVINTLLPILGINYFYKHFSHIKNQLNSFKLAMSDGSEREIGSLTLNELKESLCDDQYFEQIAAHLEKDEYVLFLLKKFKQTISDNKSIAKSIIKHKDTLKQQIYRIYRARCDIVHSTEAIVSLSLLSANLEFYLKQTLSHILKELVNQPTIESMEEIFLRSNLTLGRIIEHLNKDEPELFLKYLEQTR